MHKLNFSDTRAMFGLFAKYSRFGDLVAVKSLGG